MSEADKSQDKGALASLSPLAGSAPSLAPSFDGLDAAYRLLMIAEDDREDEWTREVCRQAGEMLNELTRLVTVDHESKAAFVARVRSALKLPNDPVSNGPESGPHRQQNDRTP